jgi:hypothetical protein
VDLVFLCAGRGDVRAVWMCTYMNMCVHSTRLCLQVVCAYMHVRLSLCMFECVLEHTCARVRGCV